MENKKKYKGFSFIEAILSVFVVSMGMTAAVGLLSNGLRESMDSRDQQIAALLAQESLELARNIRDNNWSQGKDTFDGIDNSNTCKIGYDSGLSCAGGSDYDLYLNSDNIYTHASGGAEKTRFRRRLWINSSGENKIIVSEVVWGGGIFDANIDNCNTANRCTYAKVELTKWGE
jgi:Tfp pilus assembly protein PilV